MAKAKRTEAVARKATTSAAKTSAAKTSAAKASGGRAPRGPVARVTGGRAKVAASRSKAAPQTAAGRRKAAGSTAGRVAKTERTGDPRQLAHGLSQLLHTMQVIQQHEEALCSLMHAARGGRASAAMLRDLRAALADLPAHDYLHEVEQLQELVG